MDYLIVCPVSLLAAGLALFSGFGLGTLLMPVLAVFFPPEVAIAATSSPGSNSYRPSPPGPDPSKTIFRCRIDPNPFRAESVPNPSPDSRDRFTGGVRERNQQKAVRWHDALLGDPESDFEVEMGRFRNPEG